MEECQLVVRLPQMIFSTPYSSWIDFKPVDGGIHVINIFRIPNVPDLFDLKKLSYSSLPPIGDKFLSFSAPAPGSAKLNAPPKEDDVYEWSLSFPCATDSLHTFIMKTGSGVSGGKGEANIKWWQDKQSLQPGEYPEWIYSTAHSDLKHSRICAPIRHGRRCCASLQWAWA